VSSVPGEDEEPGGFPLITVESPLEMIHESTDAGR
jgi:hypothetical protein